MKINTKLKDCYEAPLAAAGEWVTAKTRKAMAAFNLEPTPENKRSARAWAKRLDYELAKHIN